MNRMIAREMPIWRLVERLGARWEFRRVADGETLHVILWCEFLESTGLEIEPVGVVGVFGMV